VLLIYIVMYMSGSGRHMVYFTGANKKHKQNKHKSISCMIGHVLIGTHALC